MNPLEDFLKTLTPERLDELKKKKQVESGNALDNPEIQSSLKSGMNALSQSKGFGSMSDSPKAVETLTDKVSSEIDFNKAPGMVSGPSSSANSFMDKASGVLGKAKGALGSIGSDDVSAATSLISNFSGSQYNQNGDGKIEGVAGASLMAGANGFSLGNKYGGPIGGAVAAALGVTGSIIGRGEAKKERKKAIAKKLKREDALETKKVDEEYKREQGIEQISMLKSLREKQLGN